MIGVAANFLIMTCPSTTHSPLDNGFHSLQGDCSQVGQHYPEFLLTQSERRPERSRSTSTVNFGRRLIKLSLRAVALCLETTRSRCKTDAFVARHACTTMSVRPRTTEDHDLEWYEEQVKDSGPGAHSKQSVSPGCRCVAHEYIGGGFGVSPPKLLLSPKAVL